MRPCPPVVYQGEMPILHVRIDDETDRLLRKKADDTGLTKSAHVQLALNSHLRPVEAIAPRRVGKKR